MSNWPSSTRAILASGQPRRPRTRASAWRWSSCQEPAKASFFYRVDGLWNGSSPGLPGSVASPGTMKDCRKPWKDCTSSLSPASCSPEAAVSSHSSLQALTIADTVLLPFAPRGPDLGTIEAVIELVTEIRAVNENLRALAMVNRADPIGNDNAEAEAAFAEHADVLETVPLRVGNRKAIALAHLLGLAAVEMVRTDPKAVAELDALYRYVLSTETAR